MFTGESSVSDGVRTFPLRFVSRLGEGVWAQWSAVRYAADLRDFQQHLNQPIVRVENMAAGVEAGKGTVGKWVADTALADETQKLLVRANEAMGELHAAVSNVNGAAKNLQTGTTQLPEITDAVAREAKDLPGLVTQAQTSMREIQRLVEGMQRHWLVRKCVNQTNPSPIRPPPEPANPERTRVKTFQSLRDSTR